MWRTGLGLRICDLQPEAHQSTAQKRINNIMENQMTFKDYYLREKAKPSPAQNFLTDMAQLTKRSSVTVRMWLQGKQVPDALTQSLIAERLNTDASTLFPDN